MFNKSRFSLVSLILMVALLLVASPAAAQDSATTIEFTGPINAIDGTLLDVDGVTVDISTAETDPSLTVGMVVKVEGTVQDDGTVTAREVSAVEADDSSDDDDDMDTLELVGTLDSLSDSTAVVGGMEFDISGAAIEDGLIVGDVVEVHASRAEDGLSWLASSIELHDDTDDADDDSDDADDDSDDDSDDDADDDSDDDSDDDADDDSHDDTGACTFEVEVGSANVRSGPGTGNDIVGFAYEDDEFPVLAIDATGSWIEIGADQWLAISTGDLEGDCSTLTVSDEPLSVGDDDDSDDDADDDSDDDSDDDADDDSHDSSDDDDDDDGDDSDDDDDHDEEDDDDDDSDDDDDDHSDDS